MSADITLTTKAPGPPKADFAFEVDFKRGEGSPSRVFLAIHEFIQSCERIDGALVGSIDSGIDTVMVLEDIQAGSIKAFFRNALKATDDEAIKKLDWKVAVGNFLVKAKYAILRWADDESGRKTLPDLAKEIQNLASETEVRHLPAYAPPSPRALIDAVRDFQRVKEHLLEGDRAFFTSEAGDIEMSLRTRWDVETLEQMAVKEIIKPPAAPMVMVVKKPDYLGTSKWEFRHGAHSVAAKIEDAGWLRSFQNRGVDVRPGDALRCLVQIEHLYGHDNELLNERYTILRVIEVLVDRYKQASFLDGG
jgi:hypothetical protein